MPDDLSGNESVGSEADRVRTAERERLRGLVTGDVNLAGQLHATEFQLINPLGRASTKEQYLASVASGVMDYVRWEPSEIAVRLHGECAVVRYQSSVDLVVRGEPLSMRSWHTTSYEKNSKGEWQAVWSQATEIKN